MILYDLFLKPLEAAGLRHQRQTLAKALPPEGLFVEIGAGTGAFFPHYRKGHRVVAIEPDPKQYRHAAQRLIDPPPLATIDLIDARAESLPFPDQHFDAAIQTLVLCSVEDPVTALKEIKRVLKPGASLFVIEHGRPPQPALGWMADRVTPLWKHLASGCRLNRNPADSLRLAGFENIEIEYFWHGIGCRMSGTKPA